MGGQAEQSAVSWHERHFRRPDNRRSVNRLLSSTCPRRRLCGDRIVSIPQAIWRDEQHHCSTHFAQEQWLRPGHLRKKSLLLVSHSNANAAERMPNGCWMPRGPARRTEAAKPRRSRPGDDRPLRRAPCREPRMPRAGRRRAHGRCRDEHAAKAPTQGTSISTLAICARPAIRDTTIRFDGRVGRHVNTTSTLPASQLGGQEGSQDGLRESALARSRSDRMA
jgi:hypothetical protein